MTTRNSFRTRLISACAALALAACQSTVFQSHEVEQDVDPEQLAAFLADKPEALHEHYEILLKQGERNLVLNNMRIGLAAMQLGEKDAAARAFDKALDLIEVIYADNPEAAEARSLWTKENVKDFKGEPYERAMAYFYRGLLYMDAGDYQNARAVFKAAQLQDAFAEEDQNRADFALMYLMEGWASHCAGDPLLARDAYDEAREINPGLPIPADDHGLLVIRETGTAPQKLATGEYNELLTYEPGTADDFSLVKVEAGGHETTVIPTEDIFFQASTRGGRLVDTVLEGKANFKEGADVAGDVLTQTGMATAMAGGFSNNSDAAIAGLAIMLAGAIAEGVAAATRAEADVRQWDNLPNRVTVASLPLTGSSGTGTTKLLGGVSSERTFSYEQAGKCALGWTRTRSAASIPPRAPGSGGETS